LIASIAATRPVLNIVGALCMIALLPGHATAQSASHAPVPVTTQPVGASEIFDALTQADAPSDLQRLRALRDSLAGNPDRQTLTDARTQLDTLLRDAERRQGEMPPALVMSGIASRIDTAMTKMEAAHPAAPLPPFQGPPWLMPALCALSGTLAVGLAICLAALVAQGRSAEEKDEVREILTKIRRKIDDVASGTGKTRDVLSGENVDALHEAAGSITRLQTSAKEAETLLRTSSEAAEQRLQAAVAVASRLEVWLEDLPARLCEAIGQPEESDIGNLEASAPPSDRGFLLPGFLNSLQQACDEMRLATEALAEANLANARDMPESADTAALVSEMTNLSFGHALKLDDVIEHLQQAAEGLPELGRVLAEAALQLPLQVEHSAAVTAQFEAASQRAEAAWSQIGQFAAQSLPERLGDMADAVTAAGIAAADAAAAHCAEVARLAQESVATLPVSLDGMVSTLAEAGAAQHTILADAASRLSVLADTLPETGASLAASSEALKRHVARDARREAVTRAAIGEISAAAQSARADLAATAEAVSAMPAQNERLGALLEHGERLLVQLTAQAATEADELQHARNEALAGVESAIGRMQIAAERLYAGADAQEQALTRVRRAALTVAALAGAEPPTVDAMPDESDRTAHAG
jgi:hypothetical protein